MQPSKLNYLSQFELCVRSLLPFSFSLPAMTRRGPKRKSIFGRFGCFIVEQDVRLKTNFTFLAWIVSKIRRFTGDSLLEDKSLFRLNLFRVHARAENIFSYFNFCGNQVLVARGLVSKTKKCSFLLWLGIQIGVQNGQRTFSLAFRVHRRREVSPGESSKN